MQELIHIPRFLIVHLAPDRAEKTQIIRDITELYALITALGQVEIIDTLQQRGLPHGGTYIGTGKAVELADKVKEADIDVVVLNAVVKPQQIANLKGIIQKQKEGIEVWDRVDLILNIFAHHAQTSEAKLQIELARMRHMGPRIYGMGKVLSQQSAGIGTVGIGETNTELMKRHWRREMKRITDELEKLTGDHERQLERRKRMGLRTVSIVGYTNAGKTSLFNLLTGKKNLAKNQLFATLDSSVGRLFLPDSNKEILVTDTIGFIRNLPMKLVQAFKSTLMESVHADLLLHVIDVSDREMFGKTATVEKVLRELDVDSKDRIYVFNKIDAASSIDRDDIYNTYDKYHPIFISVKTGEGIEEVKHFIDQSIHAIE